MKTKYTTKAGQKLDTNVYPSGKVAKNSVTGLYWNKGIFDGKSLKDATLLGASELAVLKYTYLNVVEETVPTLLDEICAACNRTGRVGYFLNAVNYRHADGCILMLDAGTEAHVERKLDGTISVFNKKGFRVVPSVDFIPPLLVEWMSEK